MAEEEKAEGKEEGEKAPMISKKGAIVVIVFIAIYTAAMFFVLKGKGSPTESDSGKTFEKTSIVGPIIKIEDITISMQVNPAADKVKIISMEVQVEVDEEITSTLLTPLVPWIKSRIYEIVTTIEYENIITRPGKASFKTMLHDEITNRIERTGNKGKVISVLITNFVVAG